MSFLKVKNKATLALFSVAMLATSSAAFAEASAAGTTVPGLVSMITGTAWIKTMVTAALVAAAAYDAFDKIPTILQNNDIIKNAASVLTWIFLAAFWTNILTNISGYN